MVPTAIRSRPWRLRELDPQAIERLTRDRDVSRPLAALLVARGHRDPQAAERHLRPHLSRLHDPRALPDMEAACRRLARAVRDGETVLVHGDYDVDGVTGTALLVRLLRLVGAKHAWHIPNRFADGYSFGEHSLRKAEETGASVVVSVDNGTSATEVIAALAERGVDTVVTDHHEPPRGPLPPAAAIVNPKLADSRYPFRELCGGAVAFKLAWGLASELSGGGRARPELREFLVEAMAYVAIATVCDVVPLLDENRVLAHFGLRALERTTHAGLRALLEVSGLGRGRLSGEDVGFQIGPRLNASGRLGSAETAVRLLLADEPALALDLAHRLDALNGERKRLEAQLLEAALERARPFEDPDEYPVLVVAGENWHQGVLGIVAARLAERFERPAVVIGLDGAEGRGSVRSVPGIDALEVLHGGAAHLSRYGGHAAAAGLEIRADAVDPLRDALCVCARELARAGAEGAAVRPLWIDLEIPFEEVTPALQRDLERLEPFGEANEAPLLLSRDLRLEQDPRLVGADGSHAILQLRRGPHAMRAMGFAQAERAARFRAGSALDVVFTPRWNTFRGTTTLELLVHDFRPAVADGPARG